MDSTITALLLGGLISLVSVLAAAILQHKLSLQKMLVERRDYPFRVVYDKQTEFFDAVAPVLLDVNSYITTVDVWLGETSPEANERVKKAAESNQAVTEFHVLLQRYYMYLPKKLLEEANHLHSECLLLCSNPNTSKTYECIKLLFSLENTIREFVGVEKLSEDFLRAFAPEQKDTE